MVRSRARRSLDSFTELRTTLGPGVSLRAARSFIPKSQRLSDCGPPRFIGPEITGREVSSRSAAHRSWTCTGQRYSSVKRVTRRPREVSGVALPVLRGLNHMPSQVARAAGEEEALHESSGASRSRDAWPA